MPAAFGGETYIALAAGSGIKGYGFASQPLTRIHSSSRSR